MAILLTSTILILPCSAIVKSTTVLSLDPNFLAKAAAEECLANTLSNTADPGLAVVRVLGRGALIGNILTYKLAIYLYLDGLP